MNKEQMKAIGEMYKPGDYHIVATIKNALRWRTYEIQKFIEVAEAVYAEYNSSAFGIFITVHEHEEKAHFHALVPKLDLDELKKYWQCGDIRCCELDKDGEKTSYMELIKYMLRTNEEGAEAPHVVFIESDCNY